MDFRDKKWARSFTSAKGQFGQAHIMYYVDESSDPRALCNYTVFLQLQPVKPKRLIQLEKDGKLCQTCRKRAGV